MAVINWATLVRRDVTDNGINAVAGQDRTGTRLVAGLLPPALLPCGHRSMPSSEPVPAESYSPARGAFDARGLRAGRSGRFASPLDSQSLAAVASRVARMRPAGSPVVPASDACWREDG